MNPQMVVPNYKQIPTHEIFSGDFWGERFPYLFFTTIWDFTNRWVGCYNLPSTISPDFSIRSNSGPPIQLFLRVMMNYQPKQCFCFWWENPSTKETATFQQGEIFFHEKHIY